MKAVLLSRFAGINNQDPVERLHSLPSKDNPSVDLAEAVNVDLNDAGRLSRRAGQTIRVEGGAHSLWAAGDICLYVKDGMMYRLFPDFTSQALAGGLADTGMSYVEANGRVYHANGSTCAVLDEGRIRSWGIPLSMIDVAATATTGTMPAGVYQFAMTLLRADGQESGCGLAQRIDLPENGGIAFSWNVPGDWDITDAALYITQPDGEVLMQAAVVDVEAGSYTYTGGVRSLPLSTQWLDAPPIGSVLASYKGRIYIAVGEYLYATAALSYEHCDLRDYRAFDGTPIRILAPVEGGLFVGTDAGVYFMAGAGFADHVLVKKSTAAAIRGSTAQADAAIATGRQELAGMASVLFTTTEGVMLGLPDGSLQNLTHDRYAFTAAGEGAALFRPGGATQYLLSLQA